MAGYGLLRDTAGHPALIVELNLPRTIAAQGRRLLTYLIVGLAIFVVVSITALLLHLDRSLLRRLSRLSQALEEITSSERPRRSSPWRAATRSASSRAIST